MKDKFWLPEDGQHEATELKQLATMFWQMIVLGILATEVIGLVLLKIL